jgi:hypothetical protein
MKLRLILFVSLFTTLAASCTSTTNFTIAPKLNTKPSDNVVLAVALGDSKWDKAVLSGGEYRYGRASPPLTR